jgi:hypothetical protein
MTSRTFRQLAWYCVLMCGIAVLSACGQTNAKATATHTAAITATPTPEFNLEGIYTSPDNVYRIRYPDNSLIKWKAEPFTGNNLTNAVELSHPNGNAVLLVAPYTVKAAVGYPGILTTVLGGLRVTNIQVSSRTTTALLASGDWTVVSATGVLSGKPFSATLYGIEHNNKTFVIYTLDLADFASSDDGTFFQPMLGAFRFLS